MTSLNWGVNKSKAVNRMAKMKLITAMVTPYNEKLEVDYEKAAELARYLIAHGSDGLVVSGTTGESPVLSRDEKVTLFAVVKNAVGSNVQVWAGTGSYNTRESMELSQAAEIAGADGLLWSIPITANRPRRACSNILEPLPTAFPCRSCCIIFRDVPGWNYCPIRLPPGRNQQHCGDQGSQPQSGSGFPNQGHGRGAFGYFFRR
jgi:hypothetical protein